MNFACRVAAASMALWAAAPLRAEEAKPPAAPAAKTEAPAPQPATPPKLRFRLLYPHLPQTSPLPPESRKPA